MGVEGRRGRGGAGVGGGGGGGGRSTCHAEKIAPHTHAHFCLASDVL